jgi:hypothetical protein
VSAEACRCLGRGRNRAVLPPWNEPAGQLRCRILQAQPQPTQRVLWPALRPASSSRPDLVASVSLGADAGSVRAKGRCLTEVEIPPAVSQPRPWGPRNPPPSASWLLLLELGSRADAAGTDHPAVSAARRPLAVAHLVSERQRGGARLLSLTGRAKQKDGARGPLGLRYVQGGRTFVGGRRLTENA